MRRDIHVPPPSTPTGRPHAGLFPPGFPHPLEEVEYFGKRVLPLVRELEAELLFPEGELGRPGSAILQS
ncbi:hypothetical protein GCM10011583_61560 [Streptomyces camponoticapitis]|uniref:Uncharacterized protein n=1 Tax=Streptomyces camponoticapitis TaxID=1616125 RepID=A0ABQ2EUH8_9ACTN|nr:hypothetical protein [Streptomyces camponoticapitis]GGK21280.1 hypothetical protein GCM10011583_61560 [Streptomyces camponoticapitis]